MRREVLFQYDLPVEILDEVGDEEVLSVLFGRSKEKFLIPVLFSDARIFWGYPETETIYKVFEIQYVDLKEIDAKFPPAGSVTLTLTTASGKIVFPNIRDTVDDVRGAMLTASAQMEIRTGNRWPIQSRKNLLTEEYHLAENENDPILASDDDIFEEEAVIIKKPVVEEEEIFGHFAGEDDAEETEEIFEEDASPETEAELHSTAVSNRVARMIQSTEPEVSAPSPSSPENDVIIYDSAAHPGNEQWHGEGGGDAEILPRGRPWKNMPKANTPAAPEREVFSPEDDDSEVYVGSARPKLTVPQPKVSASVVVSDSDETTILPSSAPEVKEPETVFIEKVTVLPNPSVKARKTPSVPVEPIEPVMISRRKKSAEAVTLQPKEGIDEDTVDKSLTALRFLRDNKIISEAEYKKRSLSLFEKEE